MEVMKIILIAGDGIGDEITQAMHQVIGKLLTNEPFSIEWINADAGIGAMEKTGEALPQETLDLIREHKIAIKGPTATPVGSGHRSVNVALRQKLGLYANVRPVTWIPGVLSPTKRPQDVDFVIFRENTEDVYAGIEFEAGSEKAAELYSFIGSPSHIDPISAFGIKPVSESASKRLMKRAISYAIDNNRKTVTIVHKGNIMKHTEGAFNTWCYDEAKKELGDKYLSARDYREKHNYTIPEGKILVQDRIADAMFQDLSLIHI